MSELKQTLDAVLDGVVSAPEPADRVPGVVATVTRGDATVYEGAAGVRSLDSDTPMTTDTVLAIFSTTKAITGTTVLQCVEEGLLDLDAPASDYVPEIGEIGVLEGFDDAGAPVVRAPKSPITTRMLMLHTAGFSYSFFSEEYHKLNVDTGQPNVITACKAALTSPLLFDPGTQWHYGTNMDWAGLVVEAIRGQRLGEVMAQRVFAPLGMTDTAFTMTPSMAQRRAEIHQRGEDGSLTPTGLILPQPPEIDMGGHGLYSTIPDYTKFLRLWLGDGNGEHGRVLKPETIAQAIKNDLRGGLQVTMLRGVEPELSHDAEFFPGQRKGWAHTFMVNEEQAPTGRTAGSLGWAGLANLYYWIDREADLAGMWGTQILPFADPASIVGYLELETQAYKSLRA